MHWSNHLKKASLTLAVAATVAVLGSAFSARAAVIKWGRATDISGDANVSTAGTLVSAYSCYGGSPSVSPVVNGVKFTGLASGTSPDGTITSSGGVTSFSNYNNSNGAYGAPPRFPSNFSHNYQALLNSAFFSSTTADPLAFTLDDLTPGTKYQFEVWVNDMRNLAASRTEKVSDGAGNSVTLAYHTGTLNAGQFVLGTFTADSTGHQVITFTGIGNTSPQINAFQLRAIISGTPGVTLAADTSHPATSTFVIGRPVGLAFRVRGDKPPEKDLRLDVKVVGANGHLVREENLAVVPNAAGDWMTTIAGPNHRFGFYRVYAHLSDGVTLPKLGSRPEGYLTYCVVPDPAKRPLLPFKDNFFGMQGTANVDVLPYLGVRLVLGGCSWGQMEPVKAGQFAAEIAAAKKTGKFPPQLALLRSQQRWAGSQHVGGSKQWKVYSPILSFYVGPPQWATIPETRGGDTAALTPAGEKAWAGYCRAVGRFFAGRRGGWHIYQITWEPDYPWDFKGTYRQLIRIYKIAYKALHATDPRAMVFGPTYAGIQKGEVARTIRCLKEGMGKYLDGISIHPYIGYIRFPPEKNGLMKSIRKLKTAIYKYTGKHLPIIGTEQGFSTNGNKSMEVRSAEALIRANLIELGEGFQFNYAFYLTDFPRGAGGDGYGLYYNLVPHSVWYPNKIGPKPASPAYAAMTFLLTGYKSVGTIQWLGPNTLGYAFQRGSDVILALWDYGNTPRKVTVPTGVKTVKVYDWMGNSHTLNTTVGRQIVLTLGPEPTYIKGVLPAIWGAGAIHPLAVVENSFRAFPGQKVVVRATVATATGRPGTGRLTLTLGGKGLSGGAVSRAVTLGKSPAKVELPLVLPPGIRVGHHIANLRLTQGKTVVATTGVMLNVISPVEVVSAKPAFKNGKTLVMVVARNRTSAAITANLALDAKALRAAIPGKSVTLKPRASTHVSFDVSAFRPANNRYYTFQVRVADGVGRRSTTAFNLSFNPIPFVAAPLQLHVPLHSWGTGPVVALAGRSHIVRSPQYYKGHLAARARFAWDKSNFYIAFNVTDPVYVQQYTGYNTWKGDCLQLEFNLDPGKKAKHTGNKAFDEGSIRQTEIDVALTSKGPQAYRTQSYGAQLPNGQLSQSQCHVEVWRTAKGLDYRIAIPWKSLGANHAPRPGRCVGFAAYVNSMNSTTQPDPTALGLFVRYEAKNPRQFGTFILVGKKK